MYALSDKNKKLFKSISVILIFALVLLGFTGYLRRNMVPVILDTCTAQVHALGINAINNAASTVITGDLEYGDLFEIQKNTAGDIISIQARSPKINRLARELASLTQHNLESIEDEVISIAIGTFTGITLLIGVGPAINIPIQPIGVANCTFVSEFITAGINQTLHKIYIIIKADIDVALPIYDLTVNVVSEILICENLIVGKVPETYLNLGSSWNGLNLVP